MNHFCWSLTPPPLSCSLSGPLRVVVPTESVSSYMGDTALLRCEVTGEPMPVVRWQKNRDELPLTFDPDSRVVVLPSGSLQVSKVQPPDAATYRCLAENPGSARTGTDADLRVLPGESKPPSVLTTLDSSETRGFFFFFLRSLCDLQGRTATVTGSQFDFCQSFAFS